MTSTRTNRNYVYRIMTYEQGAAHSPEIQAITVGLIDRDAATFIAECATHADKMLDDSWMVFRESDEMGDLHHTVLLIAERFGGLDEMDFESRILTAEGLFTLIKEEVINELVRDRTPYCDALERYDRPVPESDGMACPGRCDRQRRRGIGSCMRCYFAGSAE